MKADGAFFMILVAGRYIITEYWQLIRFKSMKKATIRRRGVLSHGMSVAQDEQVSSRLFLFYDIYELYA